ncbi:Putative white-brown complex homolog protein 30 [Seminavis robusta]|uniref:White-brown complex homolog protein 30 n=1 Tax=Seminavis robusta TaxID=568900 RepID=A0A9N8EIP2_9STRA|nr:Putative white-brown complex homolog protein 30 [Seminavis robusta]|eukprot:Sro997_g229380.1 Putative white-brown complex homolog protein 30 (682) ;mRNA; f:4345-6390
MPPQPKHQEDSAEDVIMAVDDEVTAKAKNDKSPEVPLVRLDLKNITYAPITRSATSTSNKNAESSRTTILSNITTSISPYQLSAWMGASGSGKTSLLSVAANLYDDPNDITSGEMIINDDAGIVPKRLVGVVWQDDLLLSNLTVEETIYFSARLKTGCHVPDEQVRQNVQNVMEELGLLHVRNSLIGSSTSGQRGISGGERKRVAVASELVVRPSLLLLDEPTSGLDATTAWSLIVTLRDLARQGGLAIAVVIHQPRTEIFNMFDHLLLLNHGHMVYDGPPKQLRNYLESIPSVTPLPPETGIADWLMDTIKADDDATRDDNGNDDTISTLASHWCQHQKVLTQNDNSHQQQQQQQSTVTFDASSKLSITGDRPRLSRRLSTLKELQKSPKYVSPFRMQLRLLTQRTVKQMRGERLTRTTVLLTFAYTFFSALFWWRLPDNTAYVFQRNSLLFFMLIAQSNGIVTSSISVFQRERTLLRRERSKKLYGVLPFFIAKTLSDMTNNVLLPCLYGAISYYACGFRPAFEHFAKFVLVFYLTMSAAQSMGLFLSVLIPSMSIALILAPPITLFFMIMGGFYIPLQNMNPAVRWLSWLSFAQYGYSAMLVNEFGGRDIPCAHEVGDDQVSVSIGETGQCPLPGDEVLASLGVEGVSTSYWFGVLVLLLLQIAFRVASYGVLRRTNK